MFKSLSIGSKLILSTSIVIVIGIVILISIISHEVSTNINEQINDTLFQTSKRYANKMQGALNESIVLIKALARTINDEIGQRDFNVSSIETILKNNFDSSSYATYAFLYLEDDSFLGGGNTIKQYRSESGAFGMVFFDTDASKAGGIEALQFNDSVRNFPIIQKLRSEVRSSGNNDILLVGEPNKFSFGSQKEFIAINIAMPIFSKSGKYIGAVGFMFDLANFASYLLNPDLDLYEGDTRSLITSNGIIAVHENSSIVLKSLQEVNNRPETQAVLDAIKANTSEVFDHYISTTGLDSFGSIASFSTLDNSSKWSIFVTSPKKSVLESLYKLQLLLVFTGIIFLIIVLLVVYYCTRVIIAKRLSTLVSSLETFFRFLNHEKVEVRLIKINANDELGKMGSIINENIQKTQQGLDKDTKAVEQSVAT
ncbi:MAG: cache domain-containing protein, partial [Helicobacter sp.]|nr:cache domain-containing protein [Helicobacter sp.]